MDRHDFACFGFQEQHHRDEVSSVESSRHDLKRPFMERTFWSKLVMAHIRSAYTVPENCLTAKRPGLATVIAQ